MNQVTDNKFRLYDETEHGASDNGFISLLSEGIKLMHASLDTGNEKTFRLKCAFESAKYVENAVVIVLEYIKIPLAPNASKTEETRHYECKMWLLHHSVGLFEVLENSIQQLDPSATNGVPLLKKYHQTFCRIKGIKLRTTTNVTTEEELRIFDGRYMEFCRTAMICLKKIPDSSCSVSLVNQVAKNVLPVLCDIKSYSNLQERFSCSEVFEPIAKAMQLLLRNNDCELDNKSELMEVWMIVSSLFEWSEYSKSVASKVIDSVEMCRVYSQHSNISKVKKWLEHQYNLLSVKFSAASDKVLPKSWRSGACAAMSTLLWPVVAPCLLIDDKVRKRNTQDSSYHKVNAFIKNNWEQNTVATLLCLLGVAGASGVAAAAATAATTTTTIVAVDALPMLARCIPLNVVVGAATGAEALIISPLVETYLMWATTCGAVGGAVGVLTKGSTDEAQKDMEVCDDDNDDNKTDGEDSKPHTLPALCDVVNITADQQVHNALEDQWSNLSRQDIQEIQYLMEERIKSFEQQEAELSAAMEEVKQRSANHARLSAMADLTSRWGGKVSMSTPMR
jgi:hypothetical protein